MGYVLRLASILDYSVQRPFTMVGICHHVSTCFTRRVTLLYICRCKAPQCRTKLQSRIPAVGEEVDSEGDGAMTMPNVSR